MLRARPTTRISPLKCAVELGHPVEGGIEVSEKRHGERVCLLRDEKNRVLHGCGPLLGRPFDEQILRIRVCLDGRREHPKGHLDDDLFTKVINRSNFQIVHVSAKYSYIVLGEPLIEVCSRIFQAKWSATVCTGK
jgi:hypothetical protein